VAEAECRAAVEAGQAAYAAALDPTVTADEEALLATHHTSLDAALSVFHAAAVGDPRVSAHEDEDTAQANTPSPDDLTTPVLTFLAFKVGGKASERVAVRSWHRGGDVLGYERTVVCVEEETLTAVPRAQTTKAFEVKLVASLKGRFAALKALKQSEAVGRYARNAAINNYITKSGWFQNGRGRTH
jgi:hypothetical protein